MTTDARDPGAHADRAVSRRRGERTAWWAATARRRTAALPLVLAGTMAVAINITGTVPAEAASVKRPPEAKPPLTDRGRTVREAIGDARAAVAATAAAAASAVRAAVDPPATYTVVAGDTVSGIAARYGLATPSLLALNGLGWSSIVYPGQVLRLTTAGPVAEAPAPEPAAVEIRHHTIAAGETVSGIAAAYGVSTEAVLVANGLGWSSLIFPGQTLVIPDGTAPAALEVAPFAEEAAAETTLSEATAALDAEQIESARVIIAVGDELGVGDRAIVIALATAAQESSLRNLDGGDRDSVGLFQQRPSTGWGAVEELADPAHATRLFFGGPDGPNTDTRGLLDIPGWESMALTEAAQAVQISAHPDAYAAWEDAARSWLADLR